MNTGLSASAITRAHLAGPIDCVLRPGELVGLIGPNGAGKTTLLRTLANLTTGSGRITLDGDDLARIPGDLRARRIAYMPTQRRVDWPMTVRDIVALGLPSHTRSDRARVDSTLARVDGAVFADRRIDTLSTGEQARVLLARTLVGAMDYLLLDEPTANLDPGHQIDIMDILREECSRGAGVMTSFHDLTLAERYCDRCILLNAGKVIAEGSPHDVMQDQHLAASFGIRRADRGWVRTN